MSKTIKILLLVISLFSALFISGNIVQAKNNSDKPVVIYLTRHGLTTSNITDVTQGACDFTLTKTGIKGAEYAGIGLKGVKFNAAYAGDLTRQVKTAQGILKYSGNEKVALQIDERLRECNYGSYEGRPWMGANVPLVAAYYGYSSAAEFIAKAGKYYPQKMLDGIHELDQQNQLKSDLPAEYRAETSKNAADRMTAVLTEIAESQHNGGNVLVVSSGTSINMFLGAQGYPEYTGVGIGNDAVTKLIYQNGKFTLAGPIGDLKYFNAGKEASESK